MDGGLFDTPRSTDRRSTSNQTTVVERKPEVSSSAAAPTHHQNDSRHHLPSTKERSPSKMRTIVIAGIIVLALAALGYWLFLQRTTTTASTIDSSKYQAVFFTNGQVYFGKLSILNDDYMKLKNIYYLQNQSATDSDTKNPQELDTTTQVQLIKLGEELHGPEDEMIIARDQVLFFENLKSDGKVSQKIAESKK